MTTFCIRVGMALYWRNWFWVVERKQDGCWRLRALATNERRVLPPSAFFEALGHGMMILSEHPGNPLLLASADELTRLRKKFATTGAGSRRPVGTDTPSLWMDVAAQDLTCVRVAAQKWRSR